MKFREILRFELTYQLRRVSTGLFFAILAFVLNALILLALPTGILVALLWPEVKRKQEPCQTHPVDPVILSKKEMPILKT